MLVLKPEGQKTEGKEEREPTNIDSACRSKRGRGNVRKMRQTREKENTTYDAASPGLFSAIISRNV